jgi:hypothetical protein
VFRVVRDAIAARIEAFVSEQEDGDLLSEQEDGDLLHVRGEE